MQRFLPIVIACFVVFATSGAHRAAAAWLDEPSSGAVVTLGQAVEKSKGHCCKTYKIHKDHQASACSLPLVLLSAPVEVVNRQAGADSWSIRAGPPLVGVLFGPSEQPPKQV